MDAIFTETENSKTYITGYSLIDITNTGVFGDYKKSSSFFDNAHQIVNDKISWERSRNQQRNWDTLVQLISMITQPIILQQSKLLQEENLKKYHFGYSGKSNVWQFSITSEHVDIFDSPLVVGGRLKEICHKIPIITGLLESIDFEISMFDTTNNVNLYFEKNDYR